MWTFMAGNKTTGALVASMAVPNKVSASPRAARLITLAVAGAIKKASAQSASEMWGISHPCSLLRKSSSSHALLPVKVDIVRGVMKEVADCVKITSTSLPFFLMALIISGIL